MAQNTKIEWADSTFNPWIGCTKVSPACDFCYAATMSAFRGWTRWGTGEPRKRTQTWGNPLRWQREMLDSASSAPGHFSYAADGRRRRVFCASLADIFDNEVDPAWRADLFRLIEETPDLEYMLLTKRVGNVVKMVADARGAKGLPENAAIGATIENQTVWDRDSEKLFRAKEATGALYSFTSFEPMLGPIDMRGRHPDWVIVGGESMSKGSRRMEADWARSVRDQCAKAGTPFIFKQWGDWNEAGERVGKKKAGRVLDGRTHDDIIETRGPGYAAAMGMVTTPVPPQPQPAPIVVQGPPAPQPLVVEDRDAQTHRVLLEIAGLIAQLAERFAPQAVLEGEGPEDDDPTPTPPQPPKGGRDADRAAKRSEAARKAHATRKANGWVHPSKRQGGAAPAASAPAVQDVTDPEPDEEAQLAIVAADPFAIKSIRNPTVAVQRRAIDGINAKGVYKTLDFMPRASAEVKLEEIEKAWFNVRYIRASDEMLIAAIMSCGGTEAATHIRHKYGKKRFENLTEDMQLKFVQNGAKSMIKNPMKDLMERSIDANPYNIEYFKKVPDHMQMPAVKRAPDAVGYVMHPTVEVQAYIRDEYPKFLRFIQNPDPEFHLAVVKAEPWTARHIPDLSFEAQEYIRDNHPELIRYIQNPAPEIEAFGVIGGYFDV